MSKKKTLTTKCQTQGCKVQIPWQKQNRISLTPILEYCQDCQAAIEQAKKEMHDHVVEIGRAPDAALADGQAKAGKRRLGGQTPQSHRNGKSTRKRDLFLHNWQAHDRVYKDGTSDGRVKRKNTRAG